MESLNWYMITQLVQDWFIQYIFSKNKDVIGYNYMYVSCLAEE